MVGIRRRAQTPILKTLTKCNRGPNPEVFIFNENLYYTFYSDSTQANNFNFFIEQLNEICQSSKNYEKININLYLRIARQELMGMYTIDYEDNKNRTNIKYEQFGFYNCRNISKKIKTGTNNANVTLTELTSAIYNIYHNTYLRFLFPQKEEKIKIEGINEQNTREGNISISIEGSTENIKEKILSYFFFAQHEFYFPS